ncbi:MAG: patatin-like phospholipase family protein [Saprospiraceae bacterium]|nr:patatin-like phospholipase family protein [Saprospiraceae bacterium]
MRIGLCLSGGGARGIFHIGLLQAIDELNIPISIISGCSAGSLVGSLYAAGVKPEKMLALAIRTKWFSFIRPSMPNKGLMGLDYLEYILNLNIRHNQFSELEIPLKVVATNISKGSLAIFQSGEIIQPVLASCSIPVLFKPVNIQNEYYMDGGILMNLPVSIIKDQCDFIIGVSLMPLQELHINEINSSIKVLTRVLELAVQNNSKLQMELCDLLIETDKICEFSKYDLKGANQLFELGYECGMIQLENLTKVLIN